MFPTSPRRLILWRKHFPKITTTTSWKGWKTYPAPIPNMAMTCKSGQTASSIPTWPSVPQSTVWVQDAVSRCFLVSLGHRPSLTTPTWPVVYPIYIDIFLYTKWDAMHQNIVLLSSDNCLSCEIEACEYATTNSWSWPLIQVVWFRSEDEGSGHGWPMQKRLYVVASDA